MQRAASECERTVAVLSPDYLASAFTQPEWAAAFAGDPTGKSQKLIPVRVRPCELVGLLKSVVYIDLRRAVLHPRASHPCSPRARPVALVDAAQAVAFVRVAARDAESSIVSTSVARVRLATSECLRDVRRGDASRTRECGLGVSTGRRPATQGRGERCDCRSTIVSAGIRLVERQRVRARRQRYADGMTSRGCAELTPSRAFLTAGFVVLYFIHNHRR